MLYARYFAFCVNSDYISVNLIPDSSKMKIIVCIHHVPDTETKVKVGADGTSIDKTGVNFILNPYDEFALEAALRLKEQSGGETIAMTLGGDQHKETLRKALAMGIDKAVLLKDESPRDSYSVAAALARELSTFSPDCVLFGKQSIDFYGEQVPGLVAEMMGLPSVSVVVKMDVQDAKLICSREIEGGHEVVETRFPCVISAQKGLNDPRYPSLKGIMSAKTKPIEERTPVAVESKVVTVGMRKPDSKPPGRIVGTEVGAVKELVRLLHEEAKVI